MRPSASLSTQRPDLADAFQEYDMLALQRGYVGLSLLPQLDVSTQAGTFGVLPVEEIKRKMATSDLLRQPTGNYSKADWKFETATYATNEYGIEIPIDDREAAMYANYMDGAMVSANIARLSLLDAYESRAITAVISGTTNTSSIGTAWTTFATATPVTNIFTGIKAVYDATGEMPDTIAMSWKDIFHMKMCSQFQDFYKYTRQSSPGDLSLSDIAAAFGVRQVLASGVILNTAVENTAASLSQAWTAGVVIIAKCASGANSSVKEPCIGRTFHFAGDGSRVDGLPEEYYDEARRCRVMRVRHDVQEKIINAAFSYKLTGASS